MIYPLLLVGIIGVGVYWYKRWQRVPNDKRKNFSKQTFLWITAVIVIGLVITGKAHWLMGLLATLLALAGRVAQLAQYVPMFQKIFGEAQVNQSQTSDAPMNQLMSRQQAADILGIELSATDKEIKLAHKKLMQKMHPDRGGSDALAKQINLAKDVLLK